MQQRPYGLWQDLAPRREECPDHRLHAVDRIGDCVSPATIAAADYAGHRFARMLEEPAEGLDAFR